MKVTAKVLQSKKDVKIDFWLSVSKAKTFDQCAKQYKFCYIDKLPRKEFDFHAFGKFMHLILEEFHKIVKNNSDILHKKAMKKAFNIALKEYGSRLSRELKDEGFDIAKAYLNFFKKECEKSQFLHFEKPFYLNLNDEILLNGFIDLVKKDNDGIIHVADYKSTKDSKYLKDTFQLLVYAYVLMVEDKSIDKIRCSFIMLRGDEQDIERDKDGTIIKDKEYFKHVTHEFSRDDAFAIEDKVFEYYEKIKSEKLWRPKTTILCKWCSYRENCKEGISYLKRINQYEETNPKYGAIEW